MEGKKDDKVTDAQRKAYAEYKVKESDFFKAMIAKAKELYKDVDAIYPKTLFIDRQGNYGWMGGSKTIIFSDGDMQFAASNNVLYNYADVIANRTKKEWYEWDTFGEHLFFCRLKYIEFSRIQKRGYIMLHFDTPSLLYCFTDFI
ncbi:MAG: hypothetical protein MJZ28_08575 [Paludibacteraceae bacterium]|nr:hypothetical protein [Paludibacteraceae bacterium]